LREIREIIIHCSATRPSQDIGVSEIRNWHQAKGWQDIGYHYVVRRNGVVEKGRPDNQVGAHVEGHNAHSIGVCMIGGVDSGNKPDANFTRQQWAALEILIRRLTDDHRQAQITGHRSYTTRKACPSFDAIAWWYGRP
jgi:N-acetylmuramoyl-L-alanine amidase